MQPCHLPTFSCETGPADSSLPLNAATVCCNSLFPGLPGPLRGTSPLQWTGTVWKAAMCVPCFQPAPRGGDADRAMLDADWGTIWGLELMLQAGLTPSLSHISPAIWHPGGPSPAHSQAGDCDHWGWGLRTPRVAVGQECIVFLQRPCPLGIG